jgi:hypothetical protein
MTAHDVLRHNLHAALLLTDSSVALDERLPSQRATAVA